jgi:hypothetical protein
MIFSTMTRAASPGDERYPEDRWYAWLKDEWVRVPP